MSSTAAALSSLFQPDSGTTLPLIVLGFLSLILYFVFLKAPAIPADHVRQRRSPAGAAINRLTPLDPPFQGREFHSAGSSTLGTEQATRRPPHAVSSNALLVDGLISFRYTYAASYETSNCSPDEISSNRKERAKILSRILFLGNVQSPPPRGSTVVVSLASDDNLGCPQLRRLMFLLGTYFSLFVLLRVHENDTENDVRLMIEKVRGSGSDQLPDQVLPKHRIVVAKSRIGKIALVRQLGKVSFVLEYEEDVEKELVRFGYQVLIYDKDTKGDWSADKMTSRLAAKVMV